MKFKVGDRVRAISAGGTFSTYINFFYENGLEKFKEFWAEGKRLPVGEYTVVATGKHREPRQYGTIYLLRNKDGEIYISNNDRNSLTFIESKGEGKMKAYELMKLAMENPQKYEGKKYRVEGIVKDFEGRQLFGLAVTGGRLVKNTDNSHTYAYISTDAMLEEISQSVPFLEAIKAYSEGKTIRCEWDSKNNKYDPKQNSPDNPWMRDNKGRPVTAKEILHGGWYIE